VLEEDLKRAYYGRRLRLSRGEQPGRARSGSRQSLDDAREDRAPYARIAASTAQYTLHSSANATGCCVTHTVRLPGGPDININDMVAFSRAGAAETPELNAEFIDGRCRARGNTHRVCGTARGLMVPVVRDAHKLDRRACVR
jgi:hypothetical protein